MLQNSYNRNTTEQQNGELRLPSNSAYESKTVIPLHHLHSLWLKMNQEGERAVSAFLSSVNAPWSSIWAPASWDPSAGSVLGCSCLYSNPFKTPKLRCSSLRGGVAIPIQEALHTLTKELHQATASSLLQQIISMWCLDIKHIHNSLCASELFLPILAIVNKHCNTFQESNQTNPLPPRKYMLHI